MQTWREGVPATLADAMTGSVPLVAITGQVKGGGQKQKLVTAANMGGGGSQPLVVIPDK